jgi:hypothetical protein
MHSLESLRELRELQFFLDNLGKQSYPPPRQGEVIATITYNLKTRDITARTVHPQVTQKYSN